MLGVYRDTLAPPGKAMGSYSDVISTMSEGCHSERAVLLLDTCLYKGCLLVHCCPKIVTIGASGSMTRSNTVASLNFM